MDININQFNKSFNSLIDPRIERRKQHELLDIIAICIIGIMAGAQGFTEIEDYAKFHIDWLKEFLVLPNGIPSHDTMERLFARLCPKSFSDSFIFWLKSIRKLLPEGVIAIDGKTMRGSARAGKGLKGLHIVSAWSCVNNFSLGQCKVATKSNEITAIPLLLETLVIKGAIITIDAMGCQKNITKVISNKEADYVLAVKKNQGHLYESIHDTFRIENDESEIFKADDEISCEHGRIENRSIKTLDSSVLTGLVDCNDWHNLFTIAKVTNTIECNDKTTTESRYFISSLPAHNAKQILNAVRSHWKIESMHWSLDVSFREDSSRICNENRAINFGICRKMALSFLKNEKSFKASIRRKQLKLWSKPEYLTKIIQEF